MCKFGGYPGQTDSVESDYRYTGYSVSESLFKDGQARTAFKCCKYFWNCDVELDEQRDPAALDKIKNPNGFAFCSNRAGTQSMKYTYCDYNPAVCMSS